MSERRWTARWEMHSPVEAVPPLWVKATLLASINEGRGGAVGEVVMTPDEWDDLSDRLRLAGFTVERGE